MLNGFERTYLESYTYVKIMRRNFAFVRFVRNFVLERLF